MRNQIFAGANAAVATIDVSADISDDVLDRLNAIDDVINAAVTKAP